MEKRACTITTQEVVNYFEAIWLQLKMGTLQINWNILIYLINNKTASKERAHKWELTSQWLYNSKEKKRTYFVYVSSDYLLYILFNWSRIWSFRVLLPTMGAELKKSYVFKFPTWCENKVGERLLLLWIECHASLKTHNTSS